MFLRAGHSPDSGFATEVYVPVYPETQKIKAVRLYRYKAAKAFHRGFLRRDFQIKFLQPRRQRSVELLRFMLVLKRHHKVSQPRELPPRLLAELNVNLSAH